MGPQSLGGNESILALCSAHRRPVRRSFPFAKREIIEKPGRLSNIAQSTYQRLANVCRVFDDFNGTGHKLFYGRGIE